MADAPVTFDQSSFQPLQSAQSSQSKSNLPAIETPVSNGTTDVPNVGGGMSVCDSHNELPQSEHSLLAVLEQGNPSSSAEFLTSMISQ